MGKSYVGTAIVKHFERTDHARPLIVCPAPTILDDVKYRDRDFVLIDESHHFRYPDTQRYKVMQQFLATGRRCCFLTATPRNKSAWDVHCQIKLFH